MNRKTKMALGVIFESLILLFFFYSFFNFIDEYTKNYVVTDKVEFWFFLSIISSLALFVPLIIICIIELIKGDPLENGIILDSKKKVYLGFGIIVTGGIITIVSSLIPLIYSIKGIEIPTKLSIVLIAIGFIICMIGMLLTYLIDKKLNKSRPKSEVEWK